MKKADVKKWKNLTSKILLENGAVQKDDSFELETNLGKLLIRVDYDIQNLYSIFMRFETLDLNKFDKIFQNENLNRYSFKWNIHETDLQTALDTLDFRLNNIK